MFLSTLLLFTCIFICMYVLYAFTKGTFTNSIRLEIVLRLEIGKQNMQAQDFCCRNNFGHHGR